MAKNEITAVVKVRSDGGLEQVAGNATKAASALNNTTKAAHSADRAIKGTSEQSSNATKNFSKMAQGMSGTVVRAYATLAANLFAIGAAFRYLQRSADYGSMIQAQKNYAATMGTSLNTITKSLQGASKGMLDYAGSAKIAGLAVAAGLNIKQLEAYANSARAVADVLGEDYENTLKRLVKATASGRTTLLREIGVTVDAQRAKEEYGKSINKLGKDLTEFEQKQAIIIETQRQLNETFGDTAATANPFTILLSSIRDITTEMTQKVLPIFQGIAGVLSRSIYALLTVLGYFSISILKTAFNFGGLIDKVEAFRSRQQASMEQSRENMRSYKEEIWLAKSALEDLQEAASENIQAQAQKAVVSGAKSPVIAAAAKGGDSSALGKSLFNNKALTKELATAEAQVQGYVIKSRSIFKGLSVEIVRDMQAAFKQKEAVMQRHVGFQQAHWGMVANAAKTAFTAIKLAGTSAMASIARAAQIAGAMINKAFRLAGIVGIFFMIWEAFDTLKANVYNIAQFIARLFGPIQAFIKEGTAQIIETGARIFAFLSQMFTDTVALAFNVINAVVSRIPGVNKLVGDSFKELADKASAVPQQIIAGADKMAAELRSSAEEYDPSKLGDSGFGKWLKDVQETGEAANIAKQAFKQLQQTIKANATDINEFSNSIKNSRLGDLQKDLLRINSIGSLSLSNTLEQIISVEDITKRSQVLSVFTTNLERMAQISNDPRLQGLVDAIKIPGADLAAISRELFTIEQQSQALGSSFQNFRQEVGNFSWDNLTSGNFEPLLASLYDIVEKQTEIVEQARLLNAESIEQEVLALANYASIIASVEQLVNTEHALSLEKIKQEAVLNSIEGMQSAQVKTLRDQINIEKVRTDLASKYNKLAGINQQLNNNVKQLTTEQTLALGRQKDLLLAQIDAEDAKLQRMNQQFALQTKIYQLEEKSASLEKTKQKLDVHKDILDVRKSLLDVERDIALERAKLQGMAVGREGASASDEYKIFKDQQEARRALIYEEAAQKRASLFAEYELFKLKSDKETAEFELRNSMVQDELNAKTELLNRELEERWKLLREEARIKGLETPQGSSNVEAPTLGQDSALQLQNYKAIQDEILASQQLLLSLKSEEIDLQVTLQELQLDNEGLEKKLEILNEYQDVISGILSLAEGTQFEGLANAVLDATANIASAYMAQQKLSKDNNKKLQDLQKAHLNATQKATEARRKRNLVEETKYTQQAKALKSEEEAHNAQMEAQKTSTNIAMAGQMAQGVGSVLTALAETQDQTSRSGFESAKKMNMAAAVVNTAGAIMNAMATVQPWPAALAAAAVSAAVGAAQIAAISKTEFEGGGSAPTIAASGISTSGGTTTIGSGAGGVLGDPTKNSESLSKSEELLESIHASEIRELRGMHDQIKRLNSNITGLFTAVIRGIEAGGGDAYSGKLGTIKQPLLERVYNKSAKGHLSLWKALDPVSGAIFSTIDKVLGGMFSKAIGGLAKWGSSILGGKVTQTITAQGLAIGDIAITDLLNGIEVSVQNYATVRTRKSGGWFSSSKTSFADHFEKADSEVVRLFNSLFLGIAETVVDLITDLGGNLQAFLDHSFTFDKINLKDKTTEEIQEILTNISNNFADASIKVALESILTPFQQVGESLFETAIRVNIGRELVTRALALTGTEIFIGMTQEVEVYKRRWFGRSRKSIEQIEVDVLAITENIINLSGGLEKFHENFSSFVDLFYSDAEKFAMNRDNLKGILEDTVSLNLPSTREAWVAQISAIDVFTEAGQKAYATMLEFSEHADAYYSFIEDAQEKQFDLNIELLNLTKRSIEATNLERAKELDLLREIDEVLGSSLVLTQERIWAAELANQREELSLDIMKLSGRSIQALTIERQNELATLDPSLHALKRRVWQLELEKQALDLNLEIMKLSGRSIQALNIERQNELLALDESLRHLQQHIWHLELLNQQRALEISLLRLVGQSIYATNLERQEQLSQLDPALHAVQGLVWLLQDAEDMLKKSFKKHIQSLKDAYKEDTDNLNDIISKTKDNISKLSSAVKSLTTARENAEEINRQAILRSIKGVRELTTEVLSGEFGGLEKLDSFLRILSADNTQLYSSFEDFQRDNLRSLVALRELERASVDQLSNEELILKSLQDQLEVAKTMHNEEIKYYEDQLNALLGIDNSILSIEHAVSEYLAARAAANQYFMSGNTTITDPQAHMLDSNIPTPSNMSNQYTQPVQVNNVLVDTSTIEEELKELREDLRAANFQIAKNTGITAQVIDRWGNAGELEDMFEGRYVA